MKTINEIRKESIKKDFIVNNLMKSNGLYCLVARPKVGKSLLALQLANSVATGTTIKNVSLKQMREYSFLIPELEEQQRIAKVLHLLDQKIENNQKINNNLQFWRNNYDRCSCFGRTAH